MSGKVRLFMFAKQFAPLVESGKKRMTIRLEETPRADVGDIIRAVGGQYRELMRAKIIGVHPFHLYRTEHHGPVFLKRHGAFGRVYQTDEDRAEMATLAHKDGFDSLSDFIEYFAASQNGKKANRWGDPFDVDGWLYRW